MDSIYGRKGKTKFQLKISDKIMQCFFLSKPERPLWCLLQLLSPSVWGSWACGHLSDMSWVEMAEGKVRYVLILQLAEDIPAHVDM